MYVVYIVDSECIVILKQVFAKKNIELKNIKNNHILQHLSILNNEQITITLLFYAAKKLML